MGAVKTLRQIWALLVVAILALVAISILLNGGAISELTIGLLLVGYGVIFYVSLPSSFVVKAVFALPPIASLLGASKYQDFYLLISMAVVGYLQWWLIIEPLYWRFRNGGKKRT
jgi:hypothetical protein